MFRPELTRRQGALLTLVPWVLVLYGPRIRARSKFASVRFISPFECGSIILTILSNN